jgi:predicted nucleic acid-binding protein
MESVPERELYLSVVTIGEIAKGIAKRRRERATAAQRDADALQGWLDSLLTEFSERIISVDVAIATRWGRLVDQHPRSPTDMLLAATALDHELTVATRNVQHFRAAGVPIVNPFDA